MDSEKINNKCNEIIKLIDELYECQKYAEPALCILDVIELKLHEIKKYCKQNDQNYTKEINDKLIKNEFPGSFPESETESIDEKISDQNCLYIKLSKKLSNFLGFEKATKSKILTELINYIKNNCTVYENGEFECNEILQDILGPKRFNVTNNSEDSYLGYSFSNLDFYLIGQLFY